MTATAVASVAMPPRLDGRPVRAWTAWQPASQHSHIDQRCEGCGDPGPALACFGQVDGHDRPQDAYAAFRCRTCDAIRIYRIAPRLAGWKPVTRRAGRPVTKTPQATAAAPVQEALPSAPSAPEQSRPGRSTAPGRQRCGFTRCDSGLPARLYPEGWRCPQCTPARRAGVPEPDELLAVHRARTTANGYEGGGR